MVIEKLPRYGRILTRPLGAVLILSANKTLPLTRHLRERETWFGSKRSRKQCLWAIKGELIPELHCTVFLPLRRVIGKTRADRAIVRHWSGIARRGAYWRRGYLGPEHGAVCWKIPGMLARGNWKRAAYIDERASDAAMTVLCQLFLRRGTGHHGPVQGAGPGEFLGLNAHP